MKLWGLAFAALIATAAPAHAELIRFDFAGTVDQALTGTSISAGDPFVASFVLDTEAPVSNSIANLARYDEPYSTMDFAIDGATPTPYAGNPSSFAQVTNQNQLDLVFNFDINSAPFSGGVAGTAFGRFQVQYFTAGLFGSVADLTTLDTALLASLTPFQPVVGAGSNNYADITLTQAVVTVISESVPVPATLLLLGVGVLGLRAGRRHHMQPRIEESAKGGQPG
jgi:hypothetical protein